MSIPTPYSRVPNTPLMNANLTHKFDLISAGIIFYFISAFLTFIQT